MGRILRQNYWAIYKSIEFGLSNHDFDNSSKWYLHASNYYKNDIAAKKLNFVDNIECFYLPITPDDLESAYSVENYCEYKGEELKITQYNEEKSEIFINLSNLTFDSLYDELLNRLTEKLHLGDAVKVFNSNLGRGTVGEERLHLHIPDSEILNVWEIHKPIDGFPFKGPEKVWVKRDGVWLR